MNGRPEATSSSGPNLMATHSPSRRPFLGRLFGGLLILAFALTATSWLTSGLAAQNKKEEEEETTKGRKKPPEVEDEEPVKPRKKKAPEVEDEEPVKKPRKTVK